MSKLKQFFESGKCAGMINKWSNYFDIYEKHFQKYVNRKVIFLEIGVQRGGSLKMWKDYFGENATVIGVDIDASCKQHEDTNNNIHVRIGDQTDFNFLQAVIEEFGSFDVVLDDGSHHAQHVFPTFKYLYPKLSSGSLYMVEDLEHAYYPSSGSDMPENFITKTKQFIDLLHAHCSQSAQGCKSVSIDETLTNNTFCISCYCGIVCLEKKQLPPRTNIWAV